MDAIGHGHGLKTEKVMWQYIQFGAKVVKKIDIFSLCINYLAHNNVNMMLKHQLTLRMHECFYDNDYFL